MVVQCIADAGSAATSADPSTALVHTVFNQSSEGDGSTSWTRALQSNPNTRQLGPRVVDISRITDATDTAAAAVDQTAAANQQSLVPAEDQLPPLTLGADAHAATPSSSTAIAQPFIRQTPAMSATGRLRESDAHIWSNIGQFRHEQVSKDPYQGWDQEMAIIANIPAADPYMNWADTAYSSNYDAQMLDIPDNNGVQVRWTASEDRIANGCFPSYPRG